MLHFAEIMLGSLLAAETLLEQSFDGITLIRDVILLS